MKSLRLYITKNWYAITLFILCIVFMFLYSSLINNNIEQVCSDKCNTTRQSTINSLRKNILSNIYENESYKIDNKIILQSNHPILLNEMLNENPILVFRYSVVNCPACVNFALDKIKEHLSEYAETNRIIYIYDEERLRPSNLTPKTYTYLTQDRQVLGLPMEQKNNPFFFLLSKDMKADLFFVPEKSMPILTDEYLKIVKRRFFEQTLIKESKD